MPEGPEVRRITDKLRSRVKGKSLLWLELIQNVSSQKYIQSLQPLWTQVQHLFPSTCLDVICRGKQIFFFLENGICMFGGLGMEGHWYYFDRPEAVQNYLSGTSSAQNPHPKFCLHFGKSREIKGFYWQVSQLQLWYDDKRNFGNFTIGTWSDGFAKMAELGPDLLATRHPFKDLHPIVQKALPPLFFEPVTLDRFRSEIISPRRANMNICKFLMEPKYLSGIGNYLKSEILYRASISPDRTLASLTEVEINRLFSVTLNTISQAYQCGGLTHGTFLDPDMERGTFQKLVYKRAGEYDAQGRSILYSKEFDGRGTYYVNFAENSSPSLNISPISQQQESLILVR